MRIHLWPEDDQPRHKLFQQGPQRLSNAELMAILIRTGSANCSALELAQDLLVKAGGLEPLFRLSPTQLRQHKGLGNAKVAALLAAVELGKRLNQPSFKVGEKLASSRAAERFLVAKLGKQQQEIFACIFLDQQLRFLHYEPLFFGTLNEAAIYPREIVKSALYHHAARLILAHNHPSGHPFPSAADKALTALLIKALRLVDVEVIDHIIIGHDLTFSFADAGLL